MDQAALEYLTRELVLVIENPYELKEVALQGLENFKLNHKRRFASSREPLQINLCRRALSNPSIGLTRGMLEVPGRVNTSLAEMIFLIVLFIAVPQPKASSLRSSSGPQTSCAI